MITAPLLYSENTPINLLGRDILCLLKATITCTKEGLEMNFVKKHGLPMMAVQELTKEKKEISVQPIVYWIQWPTDSEHSLTNLASLIQAQARESLYAQGVWLKRGAIKNTMAGPQQGLWRSPHGHFVLPLSLIKPAILSAHGQDHCARGEVLRRLRAVWWSPFLVDIRKSFSAPIAHIPPPEGPFQHRMMDFIDMTTREKDSDTS